MLARDACPRDVVLAVLADHRCGSSVRLDFGFSVYETLQAVCLEKSCHKKEITKKEKIFKNSFKIQQYSTMTPALFTYEYLIFLFFMGVCQSAVANIFQAAFILSEKIKNNKLQLFLMIKSGLIFLYTGDHISMIFIMLISGTITIFRNDDKMLLSIGNKKKNFNNNPWFLGFPALFLWVISLSVIIFYKFYFSELIGKNFNLLLSFFRIGSLIVGGGHVVIPMMITEFVNTNLISQNDVLNGFSLVSLLPGPMFNIAGYIGTNVNGTFAGFLSAFSIFLPGMLFMFFIIGKLDFLFSKDKLQYFIRGASTAAIGFIFSSAIMIFYETTFKNGQSNFITGSFNIAICFYLLKYTKIILPFVLFIGGFNFIFFRFILFIFIK